ncbi:phage tail protein [Altererythrobacter sp. GH1-8]|uniref:phage tail protein n=1 Tax=Altererythrobacter sp. GH1-8 TaxID=3349333 RepID=UPI00374DC8D0
MKTGRTKSRLTALCAAIALSSGVVAAPAAASIDPFIGEIAKFPYNFCPRGWAETDGRLLEISSNTALFSLIGTRYGGDGRTTFALPKISSPGVIHCIALTGIFPSRS